MPRRIPGLVLLTLLVAAPSAALDGAALLAGSAKMSGPAGWSDRKSVMTVETFANDDKVRERRVEAKEALGEDLKISSLTEFLGPADVLGLRVLDVWGAEEEGDAWVWAPQTRKFQKIATGQSDDAPAYGNEPSYRDAQLLDLLPRMAEDVTAEVVGEETKDGVELAVVDVDVGEREWPHGRRFRVWIGLDDERIHKLEARGKGATVHRRVTVLEWGEADERPIASKVEIANPSSERSTIFVRRDVEYDRGIPPRTFSLRDLSKGR